MNKIVSLVLLSLLSTGAMAASSLGQVLVRVNGQPITTTQFRMAMQEAVRNGQPNNAETRNVILNGLVRQEVLAQQAQKMHLETQPVVAAKIKSATDNILANAVIDNFVHQYRLNIAEALQRYQVLNKRYVDEKEYHIKQVVLKDQAAADKLIRDLKRHRKSFAYAARYSLDPVSKDKGGDVGWLMGSNLLPQARDAILKAKKGEILDQPIHTDLGYHVIQVVGVRPYKLPSFDSLKPEIEKQLLKEHIEAYINQLTQASKIQK